MTVQESLRVYRAAIVGALGGWIGEDLAAHLVGGSGDVLGPLSGAILGACVGLPILGILDPNRQDFGRIQAAARGAVAGAVGGGLARALADRWPGGDWSASASAWLVLGTALGAAVGIGALREGPSAILRPMILGGLGGLVGDLLSAGSADTSALIPGLFIGSALAFARPHDQNGDHPSFATDPA